MAVSPADTPASWIFFLGAEVGGLHECSQGMIKLLEAAPKPVFVVPATPPTVFKCWSRHSPNTSPIQRGMARVQFDLVSRCTRTYSADGAAERNEEKAMPGRRIKRAVPCRAMPCRAAPCRAVPCHAMPCHAVPCHDTAVPYHAVPCHAVPGHTVPCRDMPGHAVPCRAVQSP